MRIADAFCISMLMIKKELRDNPDKQYRKKSGITIKLKDVLNCYSRLLDILYPDLTDNDIVKVVRCKNCGHRCKVPGPKPTQKIWVCSFSQERTPDDGFCHKGYEK